MRSTTLAAAMACAAFAAPALADSWTLGFSGVALNHVYRTFENDTEIITRVAVNSDKVRTGVEAAQITNGVVLNGTLDADGTAIQIASGFNDSIDPNAGEYLGTELTVGGVIEAHQAWAGYHFASGYHSIWRNSDSSSVFQFVSVEMGYSFVVPDGGFGASTGLGFDPFDPGSGGGVSFSLNAPPMQVFVDFFGSDLSAITDAFWYRTIRFKVDMPGPQNVTIALPYDGFGPDGLGNTFVMQVPSPAGVGLMGLAGVLASGRRRRDHR